jgi:hypothetical protein
MIYQIAAGAIAAVALAVVLMVIFGKLNGDDDDE